MFKFAILVLLITQSQSKPAHHFDHDERAVPFLRVTNLEQFDPDVFEKDDIVWVTFPTNGKIRTSPDNLTKRDSEAKKAQEAKDAYTEKKKKDLECVERLLAKLGSEVTKATIDFGACNTDVDSNWISVMKSYFYNSKQPSSKDEV